MSFYPSGTLINNRYEVVQGPREKSSLAGGMGLVYLCVDHGEGGRPVALKTFRPEYLPNREARDRFLREGTTWVELGYHPHIVRCYRVTKADIGSEVFFVLQLIAAAEGKRDASLRAWLPPGKPLTIEQALLFALHIARGMQRATEKIPGLVHRDLKPENILVGRDGLARITDFGLAKALGGDERASSEFALTENDGTKRQRTLLTRGIAGTPRYMSPEQWVSETLDVRSDIFALGCILYEMLKGEFALSGQGPEEISMGKFKVLPEGVAELLARCLSLQREERFTNWETLERRLGEVYKELAGETAPEALASEGEEAAVGLSYNDIGGSYQDIGRFRVAIEYFNKALDIALTQQDLSLEAAALSNLGTAYARLGDVHKAINFFEKALVISRKISNRHMEEANLGHLNNAYRMLGDTRQALEFCYQHLELVRDIDDRDGEGRALSNLGATYSQLGDARRAIDFFKQHLAISRELGDRKGEGNALGNLGETYRRLGEMHQAIYFLEKTLVIFRELGDRHQEGVALGNLGAAYLQLGDAQNAIKFFELRLAIAREIGDVRGEAMTSFNMAILLTQQGKLTKAQQHAQFARKVFVEAGHTQYAAKAQQVLQHIEQQMK